MFQRLCNTSNRYMSLIKTSLFSLDVCFVGILNKLFKHHRLAIKSWWRHPLEVFSALLAICGGIHRSPVNSPHKGQWRGALFSLICAWTHCWVNNRLTGDLRRHRAHCDVIVMLMSSLDVCFVVILNKQFRHHRLAIKLRHQNTRDAILIRRCICYGSIWFLCDDSTLILWRQTGERRRPS